MRSRNHCFFLEYKIIIGLKTHYLIKAIVPLNSEGETTSITSGGHGFGDFLMVGFDLEYTNFEFY